MSSSRSNFKNETVSSNMKRNTPVIAREPRKTRGSGEASSFRSQRTGEGESKGHTGTGRRKVEVPISTLAWFAGGGTRKKSKPKNADYGKEKEKAEQKPPPPKKTTYVGNSFPGGQLVRSSRRKQTGDGKVKLKNGGGFLGW
ncbi:hypothetical protein N7481_008731 [Penicillium waksmanii]|uniref:uncharacterized protein n=1 Tax=Penicillium waksmanii TaxID=69791 RepID=UPI0025494448|nr:uncharacterized protein N7481_008731 [Penicillium waksmanii]KAJ5975024.1 hypothetical protein N7481_008731 [Penicillium waksmanii]